MSDEKKMLAKTLENTEKLLGQNTEIVGRLVEINAGIRDEMAAGNASRNQQTEVFKTAITALGNQKTQESKKSLSILSYTFIVGVTSLLLVAGVVTVKEIKSMLPGATVITEKGNG